MIRVPAGTFRMGSDKGDYDEKPVHDVTLPAFEIDETEVTVAAYQACVRAGKCRAAPTTEWWAGDLIPEDLELWSQFCNAGRMGREQYPINCVDWEQARTYCKWVGKRLPTEEEWEYAARGTDGRIYPWGNEPPDATRLNACDSECVELGKSQGKFWAPMYKGSDGYADTAPVGSFPSGESPFGVLDMAGNVWEWTASHYCNSYSASKKCSNARVVRGGDWRESIPRYVGGARRAGYAPARRHSTLGFRCARSL